MTRKQLFEVVDRFREACERDDRVVAAFLGGSLASGREDEHSDLDLYVIAREDACADLALCRREFVSEWGDPVFVGVSRDFEGLGFDMLHFVLESGVVGEVAIAHSGTLRQTHAGPHRVLVDKQGLLDGIDFPYVATTPDERRRSVEHALEWFWLHVIALGKLIARDSPWVAQFRLNELRGCLWPLLGAAELPAEEAQRHARALAGSLVGNDRDELLAAVHSLVDVYRSVAPAAAQRQRLEVPEELARVAIAKLPGP